MPIKFTDSKPLTFDNFDNRDNYQAFLYGNAADIGGGTILKEEIDVLSQYPDLKRIAIMGLHQDTFEYFVETYGKKFEAIYFWKNKLVEDWSKLSKLENIEVLAYFHNQRIEVLWDMRENKKLRLLAIEDFTRLKDMSGIEKAPVLEGLLFGNKVWARTSINRFPDLQLTSIRRINHNAEVSFEDTFRMLQIPSLENLDFRTNLYPTEFIAWICANYPNLKGYCLNPYVKFTDNSAVICGKRKPCIDDITDEKGLAKIEKAGKNFEQMKEKYRGFTFSQIMDVLKS
ncbi:MAG: hypothetical protein J6K58_14640 [Lachnospiraceae bacterium]|nr:hypothetical protein [Lachnospiraceae bacterium]